MRKKWSTKDLTLAAMVAAIYAVMSYFGSIFGFTYGTLNFRFGEALTVLPFLFPWAAPGLFVGCLVVNLLSPYGVMDVVVGSAATLIAALWTSRVKSKWLAPLPPVICNAILVGFTIGWAEAGGFTAAFPMAWMINGLSVGICELVVCYALGLPLLELLPTIKPLRGLMPERS